MGGPRATLRGHVVTHECPGFSDDRHIVQRLRGTVFLQNARLPGADRGLIDGEHSFLRTCPSAHPARWWKWYKVPGSHAALGFPFLKISVKRGSYLWAATKASRNPLRKGSW